MSVPNLDIFSAEQIAQLRTAVAEEIIARVSGKITTGSQNGKSYGLQLMSIDELNHLSSEIALRSDTDHGQVRGINFC